MGLHQQAVKGAFWSAVESWGRQFFSLFTFFLLARLLSPEIFGLTALASIFVAFMQLFLDQGLAQAIIQRKEISKEHLNTAFWICAVIGFFLTIVSILLAPFASSFFDEPKLTSIIRVLSLGFIFGSLSSVQDAILSRNLEFKPLALRTLIATVASGLLGIVMALNGFGVWSLVGQQLCSNFVSTVMLWKVSSWRPAFEFSFQHGKELASFGISVVGFNVFNFFNKRTDDLLIGKFLGTVQLGYYSVAYRLLLISSQMLISIISRVALPTFSKLQQEPERMKKAFYEVTNISSAISFPIFIGASALAPEIILVVFGTQWENSIPVMRILMLIGPVHTILIYNSSILMAMGKPNWRLAIQVVNVLVNVIGFFIVVRWGIIAVASVYVIRGYCLLPLSIWAIDRLLKVDYKSYLSQYFSPLFCSLLMTLAIFLTRYFCTYLSLNDFLTLVTCIAIGTVSYVGSIAIFSPGLFAKFQKIIQVFTQSASKA
ncbi:MULTISPECIES: MOP flippase family protein [Cyanophyceae]|uniref:MOP flippase family protein n=1 Tax=Cyanophyceae TaxID=3028117 RepID=UPI00168645BC|nr:MULTISPECIES: MOP flippase family protein [Cyanophyceae]MBD1918205.1 MOP flippase family protein [Phormidium sp. FACHB-77]MBD2030237.1 MOP flippase family protein [Phormidium sp. FACHB-322]MBD2051391.1 MOP flippase family protein [Leptolyngbya sp. FACHB-60]